MRWSAIKAIRGLVYLFYPNLCLVCEEEPPMKGRSFCFTCYNDLYFTDHFEEEQNRFKSKFQGRLPLVFGAALFLYRKETAIQVLLHRFKYNGKKEVGIHLGREVGERFLESPLYKDIDLLIPVPLHWKKKERRGYNQAEIFAHGIAEVLKRPVFHDAIIKNNESISQTRMSRVERMENVASTFTLNSKLNLQGKHILLVDDVLTTGATLEACASLFDWNETKLSMITIAIGKM